MRTKKQRPKEPLFFIRLVVYAAGFVVVSPVPEERLLRRGLSISITCFIVSVKVGPKGQITIPKEARAMFDIHEGDTLMVLGDKKRGIALVKADAFYDLMGEQ